MDYSFNKSVGRINPGSSSDATVRSGRRSQSSSIVEGYEEGGGGSTVDEKGKESHDHNDKQESYERAQIARRGSSETRIIGIGSGELCQPGASMTMR